MIYICEDILGFDVEEAMRVVAPQRRAKAMRYHFDIDRRQSLAAYLILMQGLKSEYGISTAPEFEYIAGDKPYIAGHLNIHFNMSHYGNGVACAISDHPVGVDIEAVAPIDWDVAHRVMNDEQLREIESSSDPARTFTRLWTTKESLLKQTGEGLCDDLPHLPIDKGLFTHYNGKDYVCTCCYSAPCEHEEFRIVTL